MRLGEKQTLVVTKFTDFGIYLSEEQNAQDGVLLPRKQVPPEIQVGDEISVFLYKDSKDRWVATTATPLVMLGQVAKLKVAQLSPIGAFLDWGLEKDLLLPFREQTEPLQQGQEVLVALYIDKSERLCATMKTREYTSACKVYQIEQDARRILQTMQKSNGVLPFTDKADAGLIREHMNMSKSEFKRAVGHLLKHGHILLETEQIVSKKER